MQLSVCMIVKDEEELLEQCLRSVQGVADEVCIVDTGSSDRTVAIAEAAKPRRQTIAGAKPADVTRRISILSSISILS